MSHKVLSHTESSLAWDRQNNMEATACDCQDWDIEDMWPLPSSLVGRPAEQEDTQAAYAALEGSNRGLQARAGG